MKAIFLMGKNQIDMVNFTGKKWFEGPDLSENVMAIDPLDPIKFIDGFSNGFDNYLVLISQKEITFWNVNEPKNVNRIQQLENIVCYEIFLNGMILVADSKNGLFLFDLISKQLMDKRELLDAGDIKEIHAFRLDIHNKKDSVRIICIRKDGTFYRYNYSVNEHKLGASECILSKTSNAANVCSSINYPDHLFYCCGSDMIKVNLITKQVNKISPRSGEGNLKNIMIVDLQKKLQFNSFLRRKRFSECHQAK